MNAISIFKRLFKGDQGEVDVFEAINKILNTKDSQNYYLIPKASIDDPSGSSKEIDLLLLHPILGIYVIEVKNWENLSMLNDTNDPYNQVKIYHKMLLAKLQSTFGKIPINVEYRVIFPSIQKADTKQFYQSNPSYANFCNHTFFKDDLTSKEIFAKFFNSSVNVLPNKKEFMKISELLVSQNKIKKEKIIPIITKDEVMFFDHKQLSIMNGYTGGFRIIRGVAGTGKTMILANFIANKIERDENEKFLVLCFNKNLAQNIKESFGDRFLKQNIAIYSIFSLLKRIDFDDEKLKITENTSINEKYKIYETKEAISEFETKFKAHLAKHPIDYVLCDETQDMPAGFMRVIYETIKDVIFFIDEAQKFYPYTMNSIADVFHHPKFETINMSGRVKNLKNVYRTPSNIAQCAFEILGLDSSINAYYKRSFYLNDSFLSDIDCVLQNGNIQISNFDSLYKLKKLVYALNDDVVVLSSSKKSVEAIKNIINKPNISVMTMQSVKGLEAQSVVIHNFLEFLHIILDREKSLFYRKIYVLLTRSKENLYICLPDTIDQNLPNEIKEVLQILKKYSNIVPNQPKNNVGINLKLSAIKPALRDIKDGAELVVAGSAIFEIIAGLFW